MNKAVARLGLWSFCFSASFAAGATLAVDPATSYQKVEGFGGALVWYQGDITSNPNKTMLYDIEVWDSPLYVKAIGLITEWRPMWLPIQKLLQKLSSAILEFAF